MLPCPSHAPLIFSGIHEILLKNLRSKEYKPNGAGAWLIFFNLCISFFLSVCFEISINHLLLWYHVWLLILTSLQLEHTQDTQKVMCFVVASQTGLIFSAILFFYAWPTILCVADNVQVMVMWQQHWRMRSIPAEPHWACALQFCRSLASNSPAHVLQWRGLSLSNT